MKGVITKYFSDKGYGFILGEDNNSYYFHISKFKNRNEFEENFQEYYRYGISLLSNMGQYYRAANIDNRQKMLGLIFPEKLVYNNDTFQTMQPSEVLDLLCNGGKGFSGGKKEKSSKNAAQSCVVTALGFKPKTF